MQGMPSSCEWTIADESLIEAICHGTTIQRGPRTTILRKFLTLGCRLNLSLFFISLSGVLLTIRLIMKELLLAFRSKKIRVGDKEKLNIFIGFGARNEEFLFHKYCIEKKSRVVYADLNRLGATGIRFFRIGLVLKFLRNAIGDISKVVSALPCDYKIKKIEFIVSAVIRLANYAYARAWWRNLVIKNWIDEACFISTDPIAYASVYEGVWSIYMQHGLLSKYLPFPDFNEIKTLTYFECDYLQRKYPKALIRFPQNIQTISLKKRKPRVLIASEIRSPEDLGLIVPLLADISKLGLTIHIRPIKEEVLLKFLDSLQLNINICVETSTGSFDKILEQLQPCFVAGWVSTALIDALNHGIIPISVVKENDRYAHRMLYPVYRFCLMWPNDQSSIKEAFTCTETYSQIFHRLIYKGERTNSFSCA